MPRELPIDPVLPEIVAAVAAAGSLVLEAAPGAGKTTRVPRAILEAGDLGDAEIWVVQPRRLAARLAASWVAGELGEEPGGRVGYQIRFEDKSSSATRLRFITDGVFIRRLAQNPNLDGVGAVVLDEFHERHIATDVGLALLRRLQQTSRPDLRLVVMSATLDGEAIAAYLGDCPRICVPGRLFDVDIEHAAAIDSRPLELRVRAALQAVIGAERQGDILVFLPGMAEIQRAAATCAELAERHDLLLLPLHGSLPPAEQDRAIRPAAARKVILSTNVAETSVTIDNIGVVIDSGLARSASSTALGITSVQIGVVSRASALQRTGRAGRTRAGCCVRLYTKNDFDRRPAQQTPEVQRLDLSETLLLLRSLGIGTVGAGTDNRRMPFAWLDPPPDSALAAAEQLLIALGALTATGDITSSGRLILRLPAHPRQAAVLLAAAERGVADEGAVAVALLGERDLCSASYQTQATETGTSDLAYLADLFAEAEAVDFAAARLRRIGINPGVARRVARARDQLQRALRAKGMPRGGRSREPDEDLRAAILRGFPDRVAVARVGGGQRRGRRELQLASGVRVRQAESSVVREAAWVVVVDAEERGRAGGRSVVARLVSAIEPDWLIDLAGDMLTEETTLEWSVGKGRVESLARLCYGALVIDESRTPAAPSAEASRLLSEQVVARSVEEILGAKEAAAVTALTRRIATLASARPDLELPAIDAALLRSELVGLCAEQVSLDGVRGGRLVAALRDRVGSGLAAKLDTWMPASVQLPGGRRLPVHYERDREPWVESQLQDFFGMAAGPRIAGGQLPLTLHLLAPNRRAVQVTTDLAGFWERHYPTLRKSLGRRYPRHDWPEDPLSAKPPSPRGKRQ